MLLKFKITEEFQFNDWAEVNIRKMCWEQIQYDPTDNHNKFFFFRYVKIDNGNNLNEPRYFPLFPRNYNFYEQALEYQPYIINNKSLFTKQRLTAVVIDPLEGVSDTNLVVEELAKNLKDICPVS